LYVRTFMTPVELPREVLDELDRRLARSARDVEQLLSEASRLLSSFTGQLGLALTSSLERGRLTRLDLEPLDERRALLVLNLGQGTVRSLMLELDSPLEPAELQEVANVLRERLLGHTLRSVRERFALDPELVRYSAVRLVSLAAQRSPSWPASTPLFSAGARHIAGQPEFATSVRLGSILEIVEQGFPLDHLMVSTIEGLPAVRVGLDESQPLMACSLVSYALPGGICGAVGVLGPRRMDYATTLAVVDSVGSRIADILQS
jgi:heat-inducible transcriptional repressor